MIGASKYVPTQQACRSRRYRRGGAPWHPQILADQLTLSQPGAGADYARQITTSLPRFFRPSYGPVKFWGMIHRLCITYNVL